MSHYTHYIIETRRDGKWSTLKVVSRPREYEKNEHPERIVKIGDDEMYLESEFVTSYGMLRDYYFSSNPWRKDNNFHYGVPSDADAWTVENTKEYVDGHFSMYNCTLEEINKESADVYARLREIQKKEDITRYTVEYARRLGFYGKEEPDTSYEENSDELIEDLTSIHTQLDELGAEVNALAVYTLGEDYIRPDDIRVILWTD